MTGRFASHTGVGPNVIKPVSPYAVPKDEVLIPELLKKQGYSTHAVGKWYAAAASIPAGSTANNCTINGRFLIGSHHFQG